MTTTPVRHLLIGGARSGKSAYAESYALDSTKRCLYVATAEAGDSEMAERIQRHQHQRDERWRLIESPVTLADTLSDIDAENSIILVDCLTLWLSNCLHKQCLETEKVKLLSQLPNMKADIVLVSNEVGSGVIPMGELSRHFVDESGWLQQAVASVCTHVSLIVAGLPLVLKEP